MKRLRVTSILWVHNIYECVPQIQCWNALMHHPESIDIISASVLTRESIAVHPKPWIWHQILLRHYFAVVLLVEVVLLSVEVTQFLVQWLIEQLDIPLSSADVVQHILDFVVAKRLPRVVLQDSVLHVSRIIAHLASILLMSLVLQKNLADPGEWFASWENRDDRSLCLCENRASASCSSCRTCICTSYLLIVRLTISC